MDVPKTRLMYCAKCVVSLRLGGCIHTVTGVLRDRVILREVGELTVLGSRSG